MTKVRSFTAKKVSYFTLSKTDFFFVPDGREESAEGSGTEGGLTNCTRICTMMNV
jgi:hypothetical protein